MIGPRVRHLALTLAAVLPTLGLAACGGETPYGVPFEEVFSTVVGAYRPAELLNRDNPFVPGRFQSAPDGSDIRVALGTKSSFGGRVFIPGAGPGGTDLSQSLNGLWTYDVPGQMVIADLDPELGIESTQIVFKLEFQQDRVGLTGSTRVGGVLVNFDLAKPLPPESAGNGPFRRPAFNRARR